VVFGPLGEQAAPPINGSSKIHDIESDAVPTSLLKDDDREESPRLSPPPVDILDHVEVVPMAVPTTRVFFQPVEPGGSVGGPDTPEMVYPHGGDDLPVVTADTLLEEREGQDPRRPENPEPLYCPTDDNKGLPDVTDADVPSKLVKNDTAVPFNATTNDDDVSSVSSSSPDEERTPR
jgi:hypothetical protein